MATYCIDSRPASGLPGDVHTTALNQVGAERVFSVDGVLQTYVYLAGVANTVAGSYVTYSAAGASALLTTTATGPVAIATAATVASTWGWYGIIGSFTAVSESSNTSNVRQYPLGTTGRVDDAIVQNKAILNLYAVSAAGAGATHTVQINRPWVGDDANST
jgi:hypothetical protein